MSGCQLASGVGSLSRAGSGLGRGMFCRDLAANMSVLLLLYRPREREPCMGRWDTDELPT